MIRKEVVIGFNGARRRWNVILENYILTFERMESIIQSRHTVMPRDVCGQIQ